VFSGTVNPTHFTSPKITDQNTKIKKIIKYNNNIRTKREHTDERETKQYILAGYGHSLVIAAVDKCCTHSCILCRIHELFSSEVSKVSTLKDC